MLVVMFIETLYWLSDECPEDWEIKREHLNGKIRFVCRIGHTWARGRTIEQAVERALTTSNLLPFLPHSEHNALVISENAPMSSH